MKVTKAQAWMRMSSAMIILFTPANHESIAWGRLRIRCEEMRVCVCVCVCVCVLMMKLGQHTTHTIAGDCHGCYSDIPGSEVKVLGLSGLSAVIGSIEVISVGGPT